MTVAFVRFSLILVNFFLFSEAEKRRLVAEIQHKQNIAEKEMEKTVNHLQDEIHVGRWRSLR